MNYDLSPLEEDGHALSNVPEGAKLVTADELRDLGGFAPTEGCSWYLYLEGDGTTGYGPQAIPDPPAREGHAFCDWAAQGAGDDTLRTVTGATTFVARHISRGNYVVNLTYQFDNDAHSVAAETTTAPFGFGEKFRLPLPSSESLEGLSPRIKGDPSDPGAQAAASVLDGLLGAGSFSGTVGEAFLSACRGAGFVSWNDVSGDYARDEAGNVQTSIPVTYAVTGEVRFTVEHWLQAAESPGDDERAGSDTAIGSVTGTTRVSLLDLGLVGSYEGFSLTDASRRTAASHTVNADGSSVIKLYYDRNVRFVHYRMGGGNALDPVPLRYGQAIPPTVTDEGVAVRPGYRFSGWGWLGKQDRPVADPQVMPDHDLTLVASWEGTGTTVTLAYWLENANDDAYTVAGQRTIPAVSGQTVGYADPSSPDVPQVPINPYLGADAMREAGIANGAYFTFARSDSSTGVPLGEEGALKTAAGDGSTVINLGYTRNSYTLVFHIGRVGDGSGGLNQGWHYVSAGGNSTSSDPNDWTSGYLRWTAGAKDKGITMGGVKYTTENPYVITAKYDSYISDLWPVATDANSDVVNGNRLFTWGTHHESPYYAVHFVEAGGPGKGNANIIGVYPAMSSELIINPEDPSVAHHLTAYWNSQNGSKRHHFMFESVAGTKGDPQPFERFADLSPVTTQGEGGLSEVSGLSFYEHGSMTVRTGAAAARQNAPAFSNVTYRYGCHSGDDVYFFYTYDDHTLTYHENNPSLDPGSQRDAQVRTVGFHYVDGRPVAELIEATDWVADYQPMDPFVSSYGTEYAFVGWYTSNATTDQRFAVDWGTFAPESNVNVYAAWKPPALTLTLVVPGGTLFQDTLSQFEQRGYTCTSRSSTDPGTGMTTTTYSVSGVPASIRASDIVTTHRGARNEYGLAFDHWGYVANGTELQYLFSESQVLTGDLTLTARWREERTGCYVVRYLTAEPQDNGLGTVALGDETFHRLLPDKAVSGVATGTSVTEAAVAVGGHLSEDGQISHVVEASGEGGIRTHFDFLYVRASGSVTYTVHYVRDLGADYGRTAPPEGVVRLSPDKTVTVREASLSGSTTVREPAVTVGGHTPRDSWNVSLALSSRDENNHLYVYYVSNTRVVGFSAVFHFMDEGGRYPSDEGHTFVLESEDALGRTVWAQDLVDGYRARLDDPDQVARLESLMTGRVLDLAMTSPGSILLTQGPSSGQGGNVIHLFMRNAAYTVRCFLNDGDALAYPATWDDADAFLSRDDGLGPWHETVTYPATATPPTTAPVRQPYALVGWNTAADGSGTSFSPDGLRDAPWYAEGWPAEDVSLHAQWELALPGSVTVIKTDTDDASPAPLSGAEFSLERLETDISPAAGGDYEYELRRGPDGSHVTDRGFSARVETTGGDGVASFVSVPAGYYLLTETRAPEGYVSLSGPAVLLVPLEGAPSLQGSEDPYVSAVASNGNLAVTVRNASQYGIAVTAPDSLTLAYTPSELTWNPQSLRYESAGGERGGWAVVAPDGQASEISVTNVSYAPDPLSVTVTLGYLDEHAWLLPLSSLTGGSGFVPQADAKTKSLVGTLSPGASASFALAASGEPPWEAALPVTDTHVGGVTLTVSRPRRHGRAGLIPHPTIPPKREEKDEKASHRGHGARPSGHRHGRARTSDLPR